MFTRSANLNNTIFLLLFIVAFFPSSWHWLLNLPLRALGFADSAASKHQAYDRRREIPVCTPPQQEQQVSMAWFQKTFQLPPKARGSYLVTSHVEQQVPEIKEYKVGILHLFSQHTSCALSLNENWDEDVREDMSDALDRIAPEDRKGSLYRHSAEGPDDMPAHIKSALVGASISIPISNGRLATGTWQGIWYLEFRARKHTRNVVATIQGEKK